MAAAEVAVQMASVMNRPAYPNPLQPLPMKGLPAATPVHPLNLSRGKHIRRSSNGPMPMASIRARLRVEAMLTRHFHLPVRRQHCSVGRIMHPRSRHRAMPNRRPERLDDHLLPRLERIKHHIIDIIQLHPVEMRRNCPHPLHPSRCVRRYEHDRHQMAQRTVLYHWSYNGMTME